MTSGGNWVRGGLIGAGAFGSVSLAISKSNGHLFAVKSTATSISSLENEYRILQSLDSPYVVSCLGEDYSIENGVWMYNMFIEYVPGGSVGDLLHKFGGRLDESIIRSYTRGILRGIQYLHRQGIVHCDIKGKNVLVGANGVKLADFGSSKRIGNEGVSTEALQLRGNPLWMAPEVVNQVEQGPASDIWSLGCTVLEMATGRHPWSPVSNHLTTMYRIGCTEELPEVPASLSPQIQDFLEKCLRRDPRKRWTSEQLLSHPFLNEGTSFLEDRSLGHPQSPISPLDFDVAKQGWDAPCSSGGSQICPTLPRNVPICPIFVMSSNLRTARQAGEYSGTQGMKAFEPCQSPSPRDRILQLAGDGEIDSVEERPNWFASLTGEWIVVRSPKSKFSTNLDAPFSTFTNRSSSEGIPCIQPEDRDCNSIPKHTGDSALVSHHGSNVVGFTTRSSSWRLPCIQPKDRDCGSIPKHTGDSTLVLHHSSGVFGHDDRGFSSALTVEKAMLPCIQPQDKDCSSIPKHAGDSTLVLHHGSSDVGQPDRGFSSALTVEQAKQLTKHSHIDRLLQYANSPLTFMCLSQAIVHLHSNGEGSVPFLFYQ